MGRAPGHKDEKKAFSMATKNSKPSRQQQAAKTRRQEKEVLAAEERKLKDERRNFGIKVAAAVFAALMGLSMLLPSLSAFISGNATHTASMSNVSIAGLTSVEEIDAFRRTPKPMCRYCASSCAERIDWHRSEHGRDEWLMRPDERERMGIGA